jgi:hypothetical protein
MSAACAITPVDKVKAAAAAADKSLRIATPFVELGEIGQAAAQPVSRRKLVLDAGTGRRPSISRIPPLPCHPLTEG